MTGMVYCYEEDTGKVSNMTGIHTIELLVHTWLLTHHYQLDNIFANFFLTQVTRYTMSFEKN